MANMKLDKEKLMVVGDNLLRNCNLSVCDAMDDLAAVLRPLAEESSSALLDSLLEACVKVQSIYNEVYKPSLDAFVKEFATTLELEELLSKTSVGEIASVDASFQVDAIDKSVIV